MKKIIKIVLFALLVCASTSLFADNTGCGLGTMLLKGKAGKGWEILAVFLNGNGYWETQTFAITSGTSEYQDGAQIGRNEVELYIDENMDMLAADISRGKGEHLDTLADMMGVEKKAAFCWRMKKNFNNIYTHEGITSKEVVTNIYAVKNS